jgi:hypothetical protein
MCCILPVQTDGLNPTPLREEGRRGGGRGEAAMRVQNSLHPQTEEPWPHNTLMALVTLLMAALLMNVATLLIADSLLKAVYTLLKATFPKRMASLLMADTSIAAVDILSVVTLLIRVATLLIADTLFTAVDTLFKATL